MADFKHRGQNLIMLLKKNILKDIKTSFPYTIEAHVNEHDDLAFVTNVSYLWISYGLMVNKCC